MAGINSGLYLQNTSPAGMTLLVPASYATFRITETKGTRTGGSGQETSTVTRGIEEVTAGAGLTAPTTGTWDLGYITKSGHFTSILDT